MKLADIQQELIRLFDERGATRDCAVVVWHDPDRSFEESVGELELPGVEVIREEERGALRLKRLMNGDLTGRKILLYRPRARRLEGDWLADVEARATGFAADFASMQLRELNAADTREMRDALQAYKGQLGKKTVLRKLAKLSGSYEQPQQLACGLMAIALGSDSLEPDALVRAYLTCACTSDGASARGLLADMGCDDAFRSALDAWIGYTGALDDFMALGGHLLLTALASNLPNGAINGVATHALPQQAVRCQGIVRAWAQSDERGQLFELCQLVEEGARVEELLTDTPVDVLLSVDTLPCIDAIILRDLFSKVAHAPEHASEALVAVALRRNLAWYAEFAQEYTGLEAAARIQQFRHEHPLGIEALPAERLWALYTGELHRVDTWYRQMHMALSRSRLSALYGLDEDFRSCCAGLEQVYKNWFLGGLAQRWEKAAEDDLGERGSVAGIPRQVDFFMRDVEPIAHAGKRACVIVSDALRYEVAATLAEVLERGTKGVCDLGSMQAGFPSITSLGMASLLPSGSLTMEVDGSGRLRVLTDGSTVASTAARQAQLRRHDEHAVAVTYDSLVNEMGGTERKALVKDARVVYIYHNAIDAQGDSPQTERKVFAACEDAIEELFGLVQLLCRERIASQVVITADHGFLYTDEPLAASDRACAGEVVGESLAMGRRYALAAAGASSSVLMPVTLPFAEGALTGFAPRGCTRIARAGAGENYVHGGVSLQELCVPVLTFTNKRAGAKGYVQAEQTALSLVTTIDTVSNSIFNLELLQDKPVGGKVLPATYEVFVGDAAHAPVTDIARIVADRTQEHAAERVIRITLSLKPGAPISEHDLYHLYARNCDTGAVANLRDLRIRAAFAPSIDFGF